MTVGGICIVCNEERWIYYALKSIQEYIDKFVVIDNLSTDRTVSEIIRLGITPIQKAGTVKDLRNEAAELTGCDWVWWIDGDEVWEDIQAVKARACIDAYDRNKDISILNCQLLRFIDDRFHYDGQIYRMPRIYRNSDVKMYGQSFPRAIDALARKEEDLKPYQGRFTMEVRVEEDYIKDSDACFFHYAECNTLLDRQRKWYGYIKGSNPDLPHEKILEMVYQQDWGITSQSIPFLGEQPEVFG